MSESKPGDIYKLIPAVMKDVGAVGKAGENAAQHYKFRSIDDVMAAAQPAFINHGVFCAPCVMKREEYRFEKTSERGTTVWLHVNLEVQHTFYAVDGSSVPVITCGEGLDNSDKATNKAMSQAYKYAIVELLCIPTKDMAEADRDSPEQGKKAPPPHKGKESTTIGTPAPAPAQPTAPAGDEPSLSELLEAIDDHVLADKEYKFVSELRERFKKYRDRTKVSDKQLNWLRQIEKKCAEDREATNAGNYGGYDSPPPTDDDIPF